MGYKVQKPCKVCGKMYTPCYDCERDKTAFHWRTVACSMKCGVEYFKMVEEARNPKSIDKTNTIKLETENKINDKKEKRVSNKKPIKIENKIESE